MPGAYAGVDITISELVHLPGRPFLAHTFGVCQDKLERLLLLLLLLPLLLSLLLLLLLSLLLLLLLLL